MSLPPTNLARFLDCVDTFGCKGWSVAVQVQCWKGLVGNLRAACKLPTTSSPGEFCQVTHLIGVLFKIALIDKRVPEFITLRVACAFGSNTVTELPAQGRLATTDTGVPVRAGTGLTDRDDDFINETWEQIIQGKDLVSYVLSQPMQRGVMIFGSFGFEYFSPATRD